MLFRRQSETVLGCGGNRHNFDSAVYCKSVVIGVERLGNEYLVARIAGSQHSKEQGLTPASGYYYLIWVYMYPILGIVLSQAQAKLRQAIRRTVGQYFLVVVLDFVPHLWRCFYVRLTDV